MGFKEMAKRGWNWIRETAISLSLPLRDTQSFDGAEFLSGKKEEKLEKATISPWKMTFSISFQDYEEALKIVGGKENLVGFENTMAKAGYALLPCLEIKIIGVTKTDGSYYLRVKRLDDGTYEFKVEKNFTISLVERPESGLGPKDFPGKKRMSAYEVAMAIAALREIDNLQVKEKSGGEDSEGGKEQDPTVLYGEFKEEELLSFPSTENIMIGAASGIEKVSIEEIARKVKEVSSEENEETVFNLQVRTPSHTVSVDGRRYKVRFATFSSLWPKNLYPTQFWDESGYVFSREFYVKEGKLYARNVYLSREKTGDVYSLSREAREAIASVTRAQLERYALELVRWGMLSPNEVQKAVETVQAFLYWSLGPRKGTYFIEKIENIIKSEEKMNNKSPTVLHALLRHYNMIGIGKLTSPSS